MTRLYLIRHAEAEGNRYRRAHGHYDSLLTPNGHAQLEKLSGRFARLPLDAVYASDLYRARRTAQAVADLSGQTPRIEPQLREVSLGAWEDKSWGQIRHEDPKRLSLFTEGESVCLPGGECTEESRSRMFAAVTRIAEEYKGGTVAVASHGHVIKQFLESIAGRPIAHLDNASVSQVEYMCGSFRVLCVGQNDYLGEHSTLARQSWWRETGSHEIEFRFVPADFPADRDMLCALGETIWESVYGTEEGFCCATFYKQCQETIRSNPKHLQLVLERGKVVGFIQMRGEGGLRNNDLHISQFYLEPPMRGRGLAAQLLGEVVSQARAEGYGGVTLRVWYKNARGLAFYRRMGFEEIGRENGMFGTLLQMRLSVSVPPYIPAL